MSKFHVGDVLWLAQCTKTREVTKSCPVCFGNKKIHITLGNGDVYEVPCEHCRNRDFSNQPQGTVKVWEHGSSPQQVTITKIIEETEMSGTKTEYRDNCHCLAEDRLYATEAEAMAVSQELLRQAEADQPDALKVKITESYARNIGYNRDCAVRARRDSERALREAERYEAMAVLCEKKAK